MTSQATGSLAVFYVHSITQLSKLPLWGFGVNFLHYVRTMITMMVVMYMMKDADKCGANRIVFESDSDDDSEAVINETVAVMKHTPTDTQVTDTAHFVLWFVM